MALADPRPMSLKDKHRMTQFTLRPPRRPSFPFRFRPSLPGLLFRIVVSLVFGQPVGAPSFPCLPCFHLNIYKVFSCVASCASSVFSLCVPSVPVSSPFCNPCRPLHVLRSNSFRCSIASSILSLCASSVQLYPSFLSRYLLLFYSLCPFPFISLLCTPPDTCPIFSLCVFRSKLSFFLLFFTVLPISVLGLSVSLCACFQPRCPAFPVLFPLFPAAFSSSSFFISVFSFPYSPLLSSPSFSIKKKVPS